MKTADDPTAFQTQQLRMSGAKTVNEVYIYKRFPGPILSLPDGNNIRVEGDATDLIAEDDWLTVTSQKFTNTYRVTGATVYATGYTTIPSTGHGLGANDVGAYVAKKYDLSRQIMRLGNISQSMEGQTLNEFAASAATIEFNDRAYVTLLNDRNDATDAGIFFQKSWSGTVSSVTPGSPTSVITLSVSGLATNALRGYYFEIVSGYYDGERITIISNTGNTVTVYANLANLIAGDEFIMKIENLFYIQYVTGFKGAL